MGWYIMQEDADVCNKECRICNQPVVSGRMFYFENNCSKVVHAGCLWEEVEKK